MKKLLTIAAVAMATMFAKADLTLYWMVADNAWTGASQAILMGDSGSGYVPVALAELGIGVETTFVGYNASPYTNFLVKLYDSALTELAVSTESVASTALASYMWDKSTSAQPPASPYSFSGFTASIPEPTSGLLMMLGICALALKRKMV